jgi:hypothetical protein
VQAKKKGGAISEMNLSFFSDAHPLLSEREMPSTPTDGKSYPENAAAFYEPILS